MNFIDYEVNQGVAFITLNRPEKYNSVNRELALALQEALRRAGRSVDVRAVYLTGSTEKAFCAGQDLGEATRPDGPTIKAIVHGHYNPIITLIRTIEKPVVCAVNGVAAGAGANIALACDIVVAKETASFIQAFSKIGLIPDSGGTFFLPRLIGFQRASALMMLGDKIMAPEAERMGMIYKSIPNERFVEESRAIAFKLAQMPTRAFAFTKQALNESYGNDFLGQLDVEEKLQAQSGQTEDFAEGVAAFLEKRQPIFTGK